MRQGDGWSRLIVAWYDGGGASATEGKVACHFVHHLMVSEM